MPQPVVELRDASIQFGHKVLFENLNLAIPPGRFIAVLGPNGAGKTTFLKTLLGLQALSSGSVSILGQPPETVRPRIGYIPQHKPFQPFTPLRARDVVGLGVDGHRWGVRLAQRGYRRRVDELLGKVGAQGYADAPVGLLSGGEQQRLRIAGALATHPRVLLCDEPLIALDLHYQRQVSTLLAKQAHEEGAVVIFVTHEINPVIDEVDEVLYLASARHCAGPVEKVMTSEVLSELYQDPIEVFTHNGRILVIGQSDIPAHHEQDEWVHS